MCIGAGRRWNHDPGSDRPGTQQAAGSGDQYGNRGISHRSRTAESGTGTGSDAG